jgi:hypothetical protein
LKRVGGIGALCTQFDLEAEEYAKEKKNNEGSFFHSFILVPMDTSSIRLDFY